MPARKPNLLWRTRAPRTPTMNDVASLQTVMLTEEEKLQWVTVAHGTTDIMDRLAKYLSETRYQLFPLTTPQPFVGDNASVSTRRAVERKPPRRITQSRRTQKEQQDGHSQH